MLQMASAVGVDQKSHCIDVHLGLSTNFQCYDPIVQM